jgi:hypothetical protein
MPPWGEVGNLFFWGWEKLGEEGWWGTGLRGRVGELGVFEFEGGGNVGREGEAEGGFGFEVGGDGEVEVEGLPVRESGKDWMEAILRQPSARSKEMGFGEEPRALKEKR